MLPEVGEIKKKRKNFQLAETFREKRWFIELVERTAEQGRAGGAKWKGYIRKGGGGGGKGLSRDIS